MAFDEPRDWIDQAMASNDTWQPPPHFAARVVARAATSVPRPAAAPFNVVGYLHVRLARAADSVRGYLEASAWVIGQYRDIFLRSG